MFREREILESLWGFCLPRPVMYVRVLTIENPIGHVKTVCGQRWPKRGGDTFYRVSRYYNRCRAERGVVGSGGKPFNAWALSCLFRRRRRKATLRATDNPGTGRLLYLPPSHISTPLTMRATLMIAQRDDRHLHLYFNGNRSCFPRGARRVCPLR